MVRYLGLTVFVQSTAHNLSSSASSNRKFNPLHWRTVDLVSSRVNYTEEKQNIAALRTNCSIKCNILSKREVRTQWKDAKCCWVHESDKLFSGFSDSTDKRLRPPRCDRNIWVDVFKFLPLLEASPCSNSRRNNIISHTSGGPKTGQGPEQAVGTWWTQVLTRQCKSGNWVRMHSGEICCQNNRSHGTLSGSSENYFATYPVSLLASEVFYKMEAIFHKIKGPEYQSKFLHSTVAQVSK